VAPGRALTRDGFIEDLSWKYMVWFYNQVDAVHVPSRDIQRDLEQKGIAPDRLRLLTRPSRESGQAGCRRRPFPKPSSGEKIQT